MRKVVFLSVCLFIVPLLAFAEAPPTDYEKSWPQWRGPYANGVSPYGNPPIQWDESNNIKWKIEIPGMGHATPVTWDNLIFVLTAVETDKKIASKKEVPAQPDQGQGQRRPMNTTTENVHKFIILAINRSDGSIQWQHTAREELPHEGMHPTTSWASNSPVTDGEHVIVMIQ